MCSDDPDIQRCVRTARHRLSELEHKLDQAEPNSLDFDFWNSILETVETLPFAEEVAWKQAHLAQLRVAVRSAQL